mgnify:CR=1 FL=1
MAKDPIIPIPLSTKTNTLWNMAGCLFYLGCQWLTTVLVVIFSSGYANSGALAFAMSVGNMFASISLFKIRTYQVSDIEDRFSRNEYIGFRLATIAFGLVLSSLYLAVIANDSYTIAATLAFLLFKTDETFVDVLYGIEQKHGRMDYIGKSQIIRGFATIAGFSAPLINTGSLLFAIAGMTTLCFLTTLFYDLRHASRFGKIGISLAKERIIALGKACLLPTIANFCATSIVSVARQRYGIFAGDQMLGIYASIATPAVLIQAGATYLYSPLIGSLASTMFHEAGTLFKKRFIIVMLGLFAAMTTMTAALTLVGPRILEMVFGTGVADYTWTFPFALMATTSIAILLYVNDILIIARDGSTQIIANALALIISACASDALISLFGMNGVNLVIILATIPAILLGTGKLLAKRSFQ